MGESGIAEEVVLGLGQGALHGVELGLEGGLVRVGGGVEVLMRCGGGEYGGDGYGGGESVHGRLLGWGFRVGELVGIFGGRTRQQQAFVRTTSWARERLV